MNRRASSSCRHQSGFTLIQVMAILGLLGVVLTVATSGYLTHQSKHYIKEALLEAVQARQVVTQNIKSGVQDDKGWSKGYISKQGENHSWTVDIDPTSGAVIVTVWTLMKPATLLWVPLKEGSSKEETVNQAGPKSLNEAGQSWICLIQGDSIPDATRLMGPLSSQVPPPGLSPDLVSSDCR